MLDIYDHEIENLCSSTVLSKLKEDDFELVFRSMQERVLDKGDFLYRQGDAGDSMAILADGGLLVRVRRPDGSTIDIEEVEPGEVLGEMTCIDPELRAADVIATKPSSGLRRNIVFTLDRASFKSLQQSDPRVATVILTGVISLVTKRLRGLDARVRSKLSQLDEATDDASITSSESDRTDAAGRVSRPPLGANPTTRKGSCFHRASNGPTSTSSQPFAPFMSTPPALSCVVRVIRAPPAS